MYEIIYIHNINRINICIIIKYRYSMKKFERHIALILDFLEDVSLTDKFDFETIFENTKTNCHKDTFRIYITAALNRKYIKRFKIGRNVYYKKNIEIGKLDNDMINYKNDELNSNKRIKVQVI